MKLNLYQPLVAALRTSFGERLLTVVLFGSRVRGEAKKDSDHDVLLVISGLPYNPLQRMREVRGAVLEIPLRLGLIAKTPEEIDMNLSPLLLDVCVDGVCLQGKEYFEGYHRKALRALDQSGLRRCWQEGEYFWQFEHPPTREWELTWEGFRELD